MVFINKSNNSFQNFAVDYSTYIMEILKDKRDALTKRYIDSFLDYILFKKHFDKEKSKKLKDMYSKIESDIIDSDDISTWFYFLYDFAHFIRFAEKCFMYPNTDTSHIFSENIKNKKDDIVIYLKKNDYKVKVSFEKTKIPDINASSDYLLTGFQCEDLYFINVEIVRNFGKQMCNTFKFVSNENPKFNDISDQFLFENFKRNISNEIMNTYSKILNSIIPNYTNIETTYWKEVIENGLWVR